MRIGLEMSNPILILQNEMRLHVAYQILSYRLGVVESDGKELIRYEIAKSSVFVE